MPALELDALEARILGVLIEKERTTPDLYPLTLNALVQGCNQKSNRAPTMELTDSVVLAGIDRLRRKGLIGGQHSSGARVERFRHTAATAWSLSEPELAVMAELLLRGAQQPGELRGRADRMSRFESLEVLGAVLEGLRQKGFVQRLEPLPGARAAQWDQIVAAAPGAAPNAAPARTPVSEGALPIERPAAAAPAPRMPTPSAPGAAPTTLASLEARVAALEAEVRRLVALLE
jgi:hypothetical protein